MKLSKLFFFCTLLLTNFGAALAQDDICASVYGKHKLFHHIKVWTGPKEFSDPMLVEIEIRRDSTLTSSYHFDDEHVETAVFSKTFPQLTYFSQKYGWQRGCVNREPECDQLRDDVRSYNLNLNYLDIENDEQSIPNPRVAANRKKVLACVNSLREQIITSTKVY